VVGYRCLCQYSRSESSQVAKLTRITVIHYSSTTPPLHILCYCTLDVLSKEL